MKGLYLQNNALTGIIDDDIGNLRYLRWLYLNDNFIEGSIPEKLVRVYFSTREVMSNHAHVCVCFIQWNV